MKCPHCGFAVYCQHCNREVVQPLPSVKPPSSSTAASSEWTGQHSAAGDHPGVAQYGRLLSGITHADQLTPDEARAVLLAIDLLAELAPEEVQRADVILTATHLVPALAKLRRIAAGGKDG